MNQVPSSSAPALTPATEGRHTVPSPLTLGTVQFGLSYGVANRTGRPSFETICDLLRCAWEGGVRTLDTASCYGESEAVLGRALRATQLEDAYSVITKVEPLEDGLTGRMAASRIEASVIRSLRHLGLDVLPACLFHRESNICYSAELLQMKERGLVKEAGVSIVSPDGAIAALQIPDLTVWQVPSNVLDNRYTHTGITVAAKMRGITVFARSIYLQGLLLMDDIDTPSALQAVIAPRARLRAIASRFGIPLAELLLRAMLGRSGIDSFVIGLETRQQLEVNLAYFDKGPLPEHVVHAIEQADLAVPEMLVNPPLWPK